MAREMQRKDVVIIGLGWTGSILAMELAQEGLEIVRSSGGRCGAQIPTSAIRSIPTN